MKNSDEQIDRMLSEHLSGKLDPVIGRCERRFQLSLKPTAQRAFWNRTVLTLGTIGISAVAAAIAMAITFGPSKPNPAIPKAGESAVASNVGVDGKVTNADAGSDEFNDDFAPVHVASQLLRRTTDEGTVFLDDGIPMRQIREREIQQSVFIDPRTGKLFEVRVPSETVKLLGMQKN